MYFAFMEFCWCICCTVPFVCMLINVRRAWSYHIVYAYLVYLIISMIPDASPPVVSMDILSSSISKFVTSVEFSKAIYSSTLISFHGCCSFLSIVKMNWMMQTGDLLDSVGNTHSILVFAQTTVSMGMNTRMETTL